MYAESAHLSTFGAETETEAEIRSTSTVDTACAVLGLIQLQISVDQFSDVVSDMENNQR